MIGERRKDLGEKIMPSFEGRGNQCQYSVYWTVRYEEVDERTCFEDHLSGMPELLEIRRVNSVIQLLRLCRWQ